MKRAPKKPRGKERAKGQERAAWITMRWETGAPSDPEKERLRAEFAGRAMQALVTRGVNFTGEGALPAWRELVADMSVQFADALVKKLGAPREMMWEKVEKKD